MLLNVTYGEILFHRTQYKITLRNIEIHQKNGTNKPPYTRGPKMK